MGGDTLSRVIETIAQATRYPKDLLTADADLENDLGIDSVKQLEIVMGLEEEFSLPRQHEGRDPSVRTIRGIAGWVDKILAAQNPSPVTRHDAAEPKAVPPAAMEKRQATRQPTPVAAKPAPENRRESRATTVAAPRESDRGARLPLEGKIALITGSGRGAGQTIAQVLAKRGATVVINSFHSRELGEATAAEINAHGGSAIHLWGSVANPQHVDQIFAEIESRYGRLDILVCNASDGRIGSFLEIESDDWDRAFRTNVAGHHRCAVKAAPLMRRQGGGSIVTLSAVGSHGFIDGLGSQGVVKAAVETLTQYLACELGPSGIRVNCVVGGPVYGELLAKFPHAKSAQHHWEAMTPDGTLCSPIDLANAIGFLVSDDAAGINGSIWAVDHGFSAVADGRPIRYIPRERSAA